jgi:hypothetical protein
MSIKQENIRIDEELITDKSRVYPRKGHAGLLGKQSYSLGILFL